MKKQRSSGFASIARRLVSGMKQQDHGIVIPEGYKKHVQWLPQIGDIFADFHASTTQGRLRFFDWAEGHWTLVFGFTGACTPVSTSEMIALAEAKEEFDARDVQLLGLCASRLEDQREWHADIRENFGFTVAFPTVEDEDGLLLRSFGMIHPKASATQSVGKSFIIGPDLRIRAIFEYPVLVGRSTDEVLRVIDALQSTNNDGLATPADWQAGDPFLFTEKHDEADCRAVFGDRFRRLAPYVALIDPEKAPHTDVASNGSCPELTRLIYASKHAGIDDDCLTDILQSSRANNDRVGITGVLIFGERFFLQVLEGNREKVARTFMRIMKDRRHHDIRLIGAGDADDRLFDEWNMKFVEMASLRKGIVSDYLTDGVFDPFHTSQAHIEKFCNRLSTGHFRHP